MSIYCTCGELIITLVDLTLKNHQGSLYFPRSPGEQIERNPNPDVRDLSKIPNKTNSLKSCVQVRRWRCSLRQRRAPTGCTPRHLGPPQMLPIRRKHGHPFAAMAGTRAPSTLSRCRRDLNRISQPHAAYGPQCVCVAHWHWCQLSRPCSPCARIFSSTGLRVPIATRRHHTTFDV